MPGLVESREVEVRDLDGLRSARRALLRLGAGLEQAFPDLWTPGIGGGTSGPRDLLLSALIWAWLEWHGTHDTQAVRGPLREVVARTLQLYELDRAPSGDWEHLEKFLLNCAALCRDDALLLRAAERVRPADPAMREYQYFHAWNGVLKYHVLNDPERVREQREVMTRRGAARYHLWPTDKLAETFVARDWQALQKTARANAEKHWQIARRERSLVSETPQRVVLDLGLGRKHPHFFWPWVEAEFAILAIQDGAELPVDSFWLPIGLLA